MADQVREAQPVAYGVFAFVDGAWWLQFPVYESEAAAHESYAMYAPGSALLTKPLYDAPAATASHAAEVEALTKAAQRLCRSFPTDDDMAAAGWGRAEIDEACNAYDALRAALKGDKP